MITNIILYSLQFLSQSKQKKVHERLYKVKLTMQELLRLPRKNLCCG